MSTLKIFRNIVLIIIAALTMLAAILFLIVWIINRHDQPPSAEANEFQEFYDQRPSLENEKNAYIYLMGFDVPEAESPMGWGGRRVAWINQSLEAIANDNYLELPGPTFNFMEARSPKVIEIADKCNQATLECTQKLSYDLSTASAWLQQESWVVDRYSRLIDFNNWKETAKLHVLAPLPRYHFVLNAQRVYLMSLWHDLQQEKSHKNISLELSRDLRFWRTVLKNSDILITKLIAVVAINNNLYWTNQIFRLASIKSIQVDLPREAKIPFGSEELSMYRTFVGEWIFSVESIEYSMGIDKAYLFIKCFFQRQHTINIQAKILKDLNRAVSVDISLLPGVLNGINAADRDENYFHKTGIMYNFFGKLLLKMSHPSLYTNYIARVADLEGARRALLLTIQIRKLGLLSDEIRGYAEKSDLLNPYPQSSFVWDEKNKELVFVGLETGERGRHSFPL